MSKKFSLQKAINEAVENGDLPANIKILAKEKGLGVVGEFLLELTSRWGTEYLAGEVQQILEN